MMPVLKTDNIRTRLKRHLSIERLRIADHRPFITSIRSKLTGLRGVAEIGLEILFFQEPLHFVVGDRRQDLYSTIEVSRHPVRAADIHLAVTAVLKIINPTVFESVPTMLRTRIFSDIPGTPGRSVQIPRMIRSIWTPARDAS